MTAEDLNAPSPARPCAECRRLKHKCDRMVPCGNCVKKGCSDICPQGTNETGKGHRRFWTRTHEMRDTLGELARRIEELEVALGELHALHSASTHRLLQAKLLALKEPYLPSSSVASSVPRIESRSSASVSSNEGPDLLVQVSAKEKDLPASRGSLSIDGFGRTRYYGTAALSSYLVENEHSRGGATSYNAHAFDALLCGTGFAGSSFPLSMIRDPFESQQHDRLTTLRQCLPAIDEVHRLKALYFMHAAPIKSPLLSTDVDTIVSALYHHSPWTSAAPDAADLHEHHWLAVTFLVCAVGSLFDPLLPPRNDEAGRYQELGSAALFGSQAINNPTIEAVQAVCLMSSYAGYAGPDHHAYTSQWALMGMAVKMAQAMGLHRDPGDFDLPSAEMQRRRRLWWSVYTHDVQAALKWSLPPSVASVLSDAKLPTVQAATPAELVRLWKYTFCRDCLEPLLHRVFAVARPSFSVTMELDKQLRTHPMPQVLQHRGISPVDLEPENSEVTMQRIFLTNVKHSVILSLHRAWCEFATREFASDPLSSRYGVSVIACYRSASAILAVACEAYEVMPHPTTRLSCIFYQAFTAAAILASIVTRCPSLPFAQDALQHLDRIDSLAQRWLQLVQPTTLLVTLTELRVNARASCDRHLAGESPDFSASASARIQDILDCVSGRTRCVARSHEGVIPEGAATQTTFDLMDLSPEASNIFGTLDDLVGVHPSVLEYLQTLELVV